MKRQFLTSAFSGVGDKLSEFGLNPSISKVAFVPTASDVYEEKSWMEADRQKFIDLGFQIEDYDIKHKDEKRIYSDLKDKDIIFVSGGNVCYLLYHVRQSGFGKAIERLLEEGKLYVGSSAGSILVGPTIEPVKTLDNSNQAPKLSSFQGLGFVDFVMLPHYGKEKYEERYKTIMKEWSPVVKLMPITDKQAILVNGTDYQIIS